MGTVYRKRGWLYIRYKDEAGAWRSAAAGVRVGDEEQARALLRQVEAKIAAVVRMGVPAASPEVETVASWGARWVARREEKGLASAKDDRARLTHHIVPAIGSIPLSELRPRHVRQLVEDLKAKPSRKGGKLSARTVRNVYGMFHTMLEDAVVDELVPANPCKVRRGELPKVADKDPEWRVGAVFTRAELEQLISHPDIPEDRRVLYAILGLGGLRFGEAAALRWRAWDKPREPLGRLVVAAAYNTREKRVGKTKTGVVRIVPVHPTLARLLATWKAAGWETAQGRRPGPDDLIIPPGGRTKASNRPVTQARRQLLADLKRIGLRPRRVHDLRRTFVSLARDAGAPKDLVALITHTPSSADVLETYSTLHWETLCAAVTGIHVGVLEGKVVELRQVAVAGGSERRAPDEGEPREGRTFATRLLPAPEAKKEPRKSEDLRGSEWRAIQDSNACVASAAGSRPAEPSEQFQALAPHATERAGRVDEDREACAGSTGNKGAWAIVGELAALDSGPGLDRLRLADLIARARRLVERQ